MGTPTLGPIHKRTPAQQKLYNEQRRDEANWKKNFPLMSFRMGMCLPNCECRQCRRAKDESSKEL